MNIELEEHTDHTRVVARGVDSALSAQMAGFEFTAINGGFERRFSGSPSDLRVILERFRDSIDSMVRQLAGWEPTPWQTALHRFIALAGSKIDWWLVGSTALAVRGIPVLPKDVDVVVAEKDFPRVNSLLADYIVEPPQESDEFIARFFTRAFIDARIEWVAGVYGWVDSSEPSDFGPAAQAQSESIDWEGARILVPPLSLQLSATRRRGLVDRARAIEEFVNGST